MRIYLRLNMFMFVTDAERKKIRNHEEVHPGAKNDKTGVPVAATRCLEEETR